MNLHDHFTGIVKGALKEAAVGEPYNFTVSPPAVWPMMHPETGQPAGAGPAWLIVVSIRNPLVGEPDICHARTVPGLLPSADAFKQIAQQVLAECRQSRDQNQSDTLAASLASFNQQMKEAAA